MIDCPPTRNGDQVISVVNTAFERRSSVAFDFEIHENAGHRGQDKMQVRERFVIRNDWLNRARNKMQPNHESHYFRRRFQVADLLDLERLQYHPQRVLGCRQALLVVNSCLSPELTVIHSPRYLGFQLSTWRKSHRFARWRFTLASSLAAQPEASAATVSHIAQPDSFTRWVELLAHAIHLAVDGSIQSGEPFVSSTTSVSTSDSVRSGYRAYAWLSSAASASLRYFLRPAS